MKCTRTEIIGCGHYLPAKVLTNDDLSKMVDTNDEWISTRTGIRSRHVVAEGELTSDMAMHAVEMAMQNAGVTAADLDLVVVILAKQDAHWDRLHETFRDKDTGTIGAPHSANERNWWLYTRLPAVLPVMPVSRRFAPLPASIHDDATTPPSLTDRDDMRSTYFLPDFFPTTGHQETARCVPDPVSLAPLIVTRLIHYALLCRD